MRSSLYSCLVFHKRHEPATYAFSTRIFMWMLDLDEIETICRKTWLVSHNRANVYSFRDSDHLQQGEPTLKENLIKWLRANGVEERPARITLLTNLRTLGYVFNPVSFFFCEDAAGEPLAVVVEVHNTFGECKPFLLSREHLRAGRFRARYPKLFYISPFSELDHRLEIRVDMPDDRLRIQVNNFNDGEDRPFFRSSLTGERAPLSNARLLRYSLRFPFITFKVIFLIHWHAVRLYLKKVPLYRKAANPHLQQGIVPKEPQSSSTNAR